MEEIKTFCILCGNEKNQNQISPIYGCCFDCIAICEEKTNKKKGYKLCSNCKEEKPLKEFAKRYNLCIDCYEVKYSEHCYIARTKNYDFTPDLTGKEWQEIKQSQGFKCVHCGKNLKLTIDHIIPVSKGGLHTKSNIQGLCKPCNSSKNNKIESLAFEMFLRLKCTK